jgi:hypothetical protein
MGFSLKSWFGRPVALWSLILAIVALAVGVAAFNAFSAQPAAAYFLLAGAAASFFVAGLIGPLLFSKVPAALAVSLALAVLAAPLALWALLAAACAQGDCI